MKLRCLTHVLPKLVLMTGADADGIVGIEEEANEEESIVGPYQELLTRCMG